jgi:prenyltransferase beta subunit
MEASPFDKAEQAPISISDLDAVLSFFVGLAQRYPNAVSHIKVGEESMAVPQSVDTALRIIASLGSKVDVEYISAFADDWIATADFFKGNLKLAAKRTEVLRELTTQWRKSGHEVKASREDMRLATMIEPRRFVTSCIQSEGLITEYPNGKSRLECTYAYTLLRSVGYVKSLNSYARHLLSAQNRDGGWSPSSEAKSEALATASAIFVIAKSLSSLSTQKVRKKASAWLARVQDRGRIWSDFDLKSTVLYTAGLYYADPSRRSRIGAGLDRIRADSKDISDVLSLDYLLLEASKDFDQATHQQLLKTFLSALRDSAVSENMNTRIASTIIMVLHEKKPQQHDAALLRSCVSYLEENMSEKGGWGYSRDQHPSLSATLLAMVAINQGMKRLPASGIEEP